MMLVVLVFRLEAAVQLDVPMKEADLIQPSEERALMADSVGTGVCMGY